MFPALRMNGLARWLAVVLALFGLAAVMLLSVALSLGSARGRATAARSASLDAAPVSPAPQALTASADGFQASQREPASR